jgi:hypothetical protein
LTVVSWPAMRRRKIIASSSSSLNRSPDSSACASALTRSSPGAARRIRMSLRMYLRKRTTDGTAFHIARPVGLVATITRDQR